MDIRNHQPTRTEDPYWDWQMPCSAEAAFLFREIPEYQHGLREADLYPRLRKWDDLTSHGRRLLVWFLAATRTYEGSSEPYTWTLPHGRTEQEKPSDWVDFEIDCYEQPPAPEATSGDMHVSSGTGQTRSLGGVTALHELVAARERSEKIGAIFREQVEQWSSDTSNISSLTQMALHPSYQRIIGLGPAVVPFLLDDLGRTLRPWFWALRAITGTDPVPDELRGKVREMAALWLEWGKENGYTFVDEP